MRRSCLVLPAVWLLLLTGCRGASADYTLIFDLPDEDKRSQLASASMRIVERRLLAMGEEPLEKELRAENGETHLQLTLVNGTIKEILTEQLTALFALRFMKESAPGKGIAVEGHGSFEETGVTEDHFLWMISSVDETTGKGRVQILFTEEGRKRMGQVFKENKGKYIGLFIRNNLVSKLLVESQELKEDIVITDIPTAELATVFADDVNVGLHVTFVPAN